MVYGLLIIGTGLAIVALLFQSIITALVFFCGAGVLVLNSLTEMKRNDAMLRSPMKEITGIVRLDARVVSRGRSGTTTYFYVQIADQKFKVSQRVMLAFKNGDPYSIYYVDREILSAEWLNESPFGDDS
ncbi:MAG: hypothetical protein Kow00117_02030 [Phototrophicales bacterium]